jgi:uncharacterized protein YprB with RNaseH-like and TPR domain
MTTLSDKLKALGARTGARAGKQTDRTAAPPSLRWSHPVEQVISNSHVQKTPEGETFVVETSYPVDHLHGRASLHVTSSLNTVARWTNEPRLDVQSTHGFTFLDTETTGLSGGTGTYAFLVGVGRSDGDRFRITQFFLRQPSEEPALLNALSEYIQTSRALVTFNGRCFDAPLLDARYITNGRTSPLPSLAHLDLLPLARRLWRNRLPSRALGSLEQYILGVTRSQEDVPGWMIPQLYFSYLRSGDARPLKSVFYHNVMDVLSMAALLNHMGAMLEDPLGDPGTNALDLLGMAHLFESVEQVDTAVRLYERALAHNLPAELGQRARQRLSFIQKRHDRWTEAINLWREAAGEGEIYAHVELAKHYEHRMHDFQEAARWTAAALQHIASADYPHASRERWLESLQHRLARVKRRQNNSSQPHSCPSRTSSPQSPRED